MLQQYKRIRFNSATERLIDIMNGIVDDYLGQGFRLTVRQLYYQLVARAIVENTEQSYKRITSVVNDARLAGVMDWDAIEDRTRAFIRRGRWSSAREIVEQCARGFHMDMWANQPWRPFVIIEKEALTGVLERVCQQYDVPLLAARGYPSGTVLREFAELDIIPSLADSNQDVRVLHLGDHDPSGIDMTRDLTERLEMFSDCSIDLRRIALNMPQIQERNPPPNPAKTTDSRFASYVEKYGHESWELDALPPQYLTELVEEQFKEVIQPDAWDDRLAEIEEARARIKKAAAKL